MASNRLITSSLLGFLALFAMLSASNAEGLRRKDRFPAPPPPPQENTLQACPEHGPGFFRLPGSNLCTKVGGSIRGETVIRSPKGRRSDLGTDLSTTGQLAIDTRLTTPYGPVRGVFQMEGQINSGPDYANSR